MLSNNFALRIFKIINQRNFIEKINQQILIFIVFYKVIKCNFKILGESYLNPYEIKKSKFKNALTINP